MILIRVGRAAALMGCVVGTLAWMAVAPAWAGAAASASPVVLHLKWRQIVPHTAFPEISTSDRYVAIGICSGSPSPCTPRLSLLDERTGQQQALTIPSSHDCGTYFAPVGFGGPYLALVCTGATHWLYNINSRQWQPVTPRCPADCFFVGVGRFWLKFASNGDPGCTAHCGSTYYLQNLQTGRVELDPARPGGNTFDDLNSPSGARRLCSPLRYPTFDNLEQGTRELGLLEFSGAFALAGAGSGGDVGASRGSLSFRLLRCGSRAALNVQDTAAPGPFISSRAVVSIGLRRDHCKERAFGLACTDHLYVSGVYVRGLRRFTASLPAVKVPRYAGPGEVVGLTRRTVYVIAPSPDGGLWAATLPQPTPPH
jgi:hypothetical protein